MPLSSLNSYHQYLATMKQNNMVPSVRQMPVALNHCTPQVGAAKSRLETTPTRHSTTPIYPDNGATVGGGVTAVTKVTAKRPPSRQSPCSRSNTPSPTPAPAQAKRPRLRTATTTTPRHAPASSSSSTTHHSSKLDPSDDSVNTTKYTIPNAIGYTTFAERLRAKSAGRRGQFNYYLFSYYFSRSFILLPNTYSSSLLLALHNIS